MYGRVDVAYSTASCFEAVWISAKPPISSFVSAKGPSVTHRFLIKALTCNLPVTFVNHSVAPHAFDLFHDSETSREIIRQMLMFLRFHLLPIPACQVASS